MKCLITALFVATVTHAVMGQAPLPDSPSSVKQQHESAWTAEVDPDGPQITWKKAATEKRFVIPHVIMWLSGVFDVEVTHAGLAHRNSAHPTGCIEANLDPHPSRGELYTQTFIPIAAMTGFDLLMRKAKMPFYIYDGAAGYGTVVHLRGGAKWLTGCW